MQSTPPPPLPDFLAESLPFERHAVRLARSANRGKVLHFIDHGPRQGMPILMQHGNPTWCYLWRRIALGLGGHRVIIPDLLGFGLSDRLERLRDHTLSRHIAALAELVDNLALDRLLLVGHDWGGPLVAALGHCFPDRVVGLALTNTSILVPRRPRGTAFHRFAHLPLLSDVAFRLFGFPQNLLHRVQGEPESISGTTARAYRWPLRRWRDRIGPLALARMVPHRPDHPSIGPLRSAEEWTRGFTGPMTLVWGIRDPILGRALARHERSFPHAQVERTRAGHFLQEEVPRLLTAAIRRTAERCE
jgi:haloalkane dehalogenase